jgi:hypothetical protein
VDKTAITTVDWERIEADFRAGILSLREIATISNGPNHVAIARRAKKEGWVRDLTARILAKADDIVTKRVVTDQETESRNVTAKNVVEVNALAVANVRLSHRNDILRCRKHAAKLLEELESLKKGDVALTVRIANMKVAAEILRTLVSLEREAWGIKNSDEGETPQTITKLVREIVRPT